MSSPSWEDIANARVPLIETTREGNTTSTKIWAVVVDGHIYVRSYRGEQGKWYQRALANSHVTLVVDGKRFDLHAVPATDAESIDAVSRGFLDKYEPSVYRDAMVADDVLHTTMRLESR